jgi:hypothetical protein
MDHESWFEIREHFFELCEFRNVSLEISDGVSSSLLVDLLRWNKKIDDADQIALGGKMAAKGAANEATAANDEHSLRLSHLSRVGGQRGLVFGGDTRDQPKDQRLA